MEVMNIKNEIEPAPTTPVPDAVVIDIGKMADPRWPNPIYACWMHKYTVVKAIGKLFWRYRYFILDKCGDLWYFKSDDKPKPCKPAIEVLGSKFWLSVVKKYAIEIEREGKPFIFYASSTNERNDWVLRLKQAGAVFDQSKVVASLEPEIGKLSVSSWTHEHVCEWLAIVPISTMESYAIYEPQFAGVDGKRLLHVDERALIKMGIKKFIHRKQIARSVRALRNSKKFNLNFHYVLRKIIAMVETRGGRVHPDQKHQLALNLSDPTAMCKSYLSYESIEGFGKLTKEPEPTKVKKKKKKKEEDEELEGEGEENEDHGEIIDFVGDPKSNPGAANEIHKIKKFPVKLVITEIAKSNRYKQTRRLLSPIMSQIAKFSQEFGMFHTALIVGPWYLEWNNSSLCIPRRIISANALISADIEPIDLRTDVDQVKLARKVAEVVCRWNARKHYDNMNLKKLVNLGNCQDFVEDLLLSLGLNLQKEGAFGRFLESMKKKGHCTMTFDPEESFIQYFAMDPKIKSYTFDTHKELDTFLVTLIEKNLDNYQNLKERFATEYRLLKSFDRAFWLRHLKFPLEEKFAPLPPKQPIKKSDKYPTGCPLKHPKQTMSYL